MASWNRFTLVYAPESRQLPRKCAPEYFLGTCRRISGSGDGVDIAGLVGEREDISLSGIWCSVCQFSGSGWISVCCGGARAVLAPF